MRLSLSTCSLSNWLQTARVGVLDLLFPPICISCQQDYDNFGDAVQGINLCPSCREKIHTVTWPTCRRCAARVPEIPGPVSECGHCLGEKLRFDRALTLGSYEGLLGELVVRMKRDRSERLAALFSSLLLTDLGTSLGNLGLDGIVPVPMHRWRRWARGANSPASLADRLGQKLGLPVHGKAIFRRNSFPQKGLSRSGRFRNMHRQIGSRAGYPLEASHVLLVDDVLTTGATCSEAARALKEQGVAEVSVLVVARTPSS